MRLSALDALVLGGEKMRYHVLDGLRGVAAAAVVTAHTGPYFGPLTFGDSGLAVDLFFCLSGFVITAAYAERLAATGVRRFMAFRYIRLYPLYLVGTALGVVAYCLRPDPALSLTKALLWSLLLLPVPAVLSAPVLPLDVPGWSLVSELAVNLFWAVLGFKLSPRRVAVLIGGALLVMTAGAVIARGHTISLGFQLDQLPFGMARAVLSFTIGIMLFRRRQRRPAMRKSGRASPSSRSLPSSCRCSIAATTCPCAAGSSDFWPKSAPCLRPPSPTGLPAPSPRRLTPPLSPPASAPCRASSRTPRPPSDGCRWSGRTGAWWRRR
jgi:peptidoglycan/LPS O-acetylase OafA/YrhL